MVCMRLYTYAIYVYVHRYTCTCAYVCIYVFACVHSVVCRKVSASLEHALCHTLANAIVRTWTAMFRIYKRMMYLQSAK